MTKDQERIRQLEDEVAALEEELEEALNPPPDWFAAPAELYEQMYARLHQGDGRM